MGTKNKSYTFKEKLKNKTQGLVPYSKLHSKLNENTEVFFIERPHYPAIKLIFEDGTASVESNGASLRDVGRANEILNNKYSENIAKLIRKFNLVHFVMFGYIHPNKNEMYFEDIYINNNWVCFDDVNNLLSNSGLFPTNTLYFGKANKSVEQFLNESSSAYYDDGQIRSIVIRPEVEIVSNSSRLAGIATHPSFRKKTKNENKKNSQDDIVQEAANEIIHYLFDDQFVDFIIDKVASEGLKLHKKNKDKILSRLVNVFLYSFNKDIENKAREFSIFDASPIKEQIKKKLPRLFLQRVKIN